MKILKIFGKYADIIKIGCWKTEVWFLFPLISIRTLANSWKTGLSFRFLKFEAAIVIPFIKLKRDILITPLVLKRNTYFNELVIGWLLWYKMIYSKRNNPEVYKKQGL